jgi:hypothetical protein
MGDDNIKTGVIESTFECVDWNYTVQDREYWIPFVDTIMNLWVL